MTSSLKQDFNSFLYREILGQEFAENTQRQITKQMLIQHKLVDPRSAFQLHEKDALRYVSQKYRSAFNMARKLKDPDSTLRNFNSISSIYGFYLNFNAFLVTIELLGNEQQASYWRQEVISGRVIGGYGQTELGHGSNVKGLETQAVYDPTKQAWVINSPTPTSTKFWPGVLGQFSTHQVIQARAIVNGQNLGIQTFVIEIRNEYSSDNSRKLHDLPKVQAFDLGPKLGFHWVDNGGLILKQHEVPRTAMLMKYVKVSPQGNVTGLENESAIKYSYGSMLNLRVQLVFGFMFEGTVKITWALHQIFKELGTDMRSDNRKFITDRLCFAFGGCLSNIKLKALYSELMKQVKAENYDKADQLLAKVHIISSTLKAISSRATMDISAEILTYNSLSKFKSAKIAHLFCDFTPSTTYEGDNTVLLQQTSKYLLFKVDLTKQFPNIKFNFKSNNWNDGASALQYIITKKLRSLKKRMEELQDKNVSHQTILNEKEQVSFIRTSELWGYMTFLKLFNAVLPGIKQHQEFYRKIGEGFTGFILERIPQLFIQGFTVEKVQTWQAFTDEEYFALTGMDTLVEVDSEPMKYIPREQGAWLQPKL